MPCALSCAFTLPGKVGGFGGLFRPGKPPTPQHLDHNEVTSSMPIPPVHLCVQCALGGDGLFFPPLKFIPAPPQGQCGGACFGSPILPVTSQCDCFSSTFY